MRRVPALVLPVFLLVCSALPVAGDEPAKIVVPARKQSQLKDSMKIGPVTINVTIEPKKTAIVICDMWDDHWCKNAATRCGELAKQMEPVIKACRDRGMTIIHCPSECMNFYKDHPARKRVALVKKVTPPQAKELPNPPLPVDDSTGGCDDEKPAKFFKAWTRENAALTIDDKDYITDVGTDVYSIMQEKGIDTVLVMGVHTNMCVLNRSFAIKQMVKWNVRTFLVRDLTDAMYSPKNKPFVTHEKGTELIIEFIEKNWCPTIESKSLVGGK